MMANSCNGLKTVSDPQSSLYMLPIILELIFIRTLSMCARPQQIILYSFYLNPQNKTLSAEWLSLGSYPASDPWGLGHFLQGLRGLGMLAPSSPSPKSFCLVTNAEGGRRRSVVYASVAAGQRRQANITRTRLCLLITPQCNSREANRWARNTDFIQIASHLRRWQASCPRGPTEWERRK